MGRALQSRLSFVLMAAQAHLLRGLPQKLFRDPRLHKRRGRRPRSRQKLFGRRRVVLFVTRDTAHIPAVMGVASPRCLTLIAGVTGETHCARLRRRHFVGRTDLPWISGHVVPRGITMASLTGGCLRSLQELRRLSVWANGERLRHFLVAHEALLAGHHGTQAGLLLWLRKWPGLRDRDCGTDGYQEDSGKDRRKNNWPQENSLPRGPGFVRHTCPEHSEASPVGHSGFDPVSTRQKY